MRRLVDLLFRVFLPDLPRNPYIGQVWRDRLTGRCYVYEGRRPKNGGEAAAEVQRILDSVGMPFHLQRVFSGDVKLIERKTCV